MEVSDDFYSFKMMKIKLKPIYILVPDNYPLVFVNNDPL